MRHFRRGHGGHADGASGSCLAKPSTQTHLPDRVTGPIDIDKSQPLSMIVSQSWEVISNDHETIQMIGQHWYQDLILDRVGT